MGLLGIHPRFCVILFPALLAYDNAYLDICKSLVTSPSPTFRSALSYDVHPVIANDERTGYYCSDAFSHRHRHRSRSSRAVVPFYPLALYAYQFEAGLYLSSTRR